MELEIKTWLFDILSAIEEIEMFIAPTQSFSSFESDLKTKRAVERSLEIIGEAMTRILGKMIPYNYLMPEKSSIPETVSFMDMIPFP
jgi:uncharacterized protein with HEPN domain